MSGPVTYSDQSIELRWKPYNFNNYSYIMERREKMLSMKQ